MYTIKRHAPSPKQNTEQAPVGTNSKRQRIRKVAEEARNRGLMSSESADVSSLPITVDLDPMLTGFTPTSERNSFTALYRDIYYNDPVGGGAADLMSTLPFGELSIGRSRIPKIDSVFEENLQRLNTVSFIPEMALDVLVDGEHVSSLLYNDQTRVFTDILPHDIQNLTITPLPFYSQDPIILAKFPEDVRKALSMPSERIKRLRNRIGEGVVQKILSGSLELDPLSTLHVQRQSQSHHQYGFSYFRRLLPYYLIEKNLYRGTLVESARRQRGIMQLTLGNGDDWIATPEDMEYFTSLFTEADADPVGAIVATQPGVDVTEHRQGGDFWKVTDFSDSALPHKLRALGISEGLLSGDATINNADAAFTVLTEQLLYFRNTITRKLFYNKLFPLISLVNGFTVTSSGKPRKGAELDTSIDIEEALYRMNDGSRLYVPTVHWEKPLRPQGSQATMDMLQALTDKGVPVSLRALAAAGGLNVEDLLAEREEDMTLRKNVAKYLEEIAALKPKEDTAEASALQALSSTLPKLASVGAGGSRSAVVSSSGKRGGLLSRDYGDNALMTSTSRTGKPKHIFNQRAANERVNLLLARVAEARKIRK